MTAKSAAVAPIVYNVYAMLTLCYQDMFCPQLIPRCMRKERAFIPWDLVPKIDPWGADLSDMQNDQGDKDE